jgi:hypothetical protein
MSTIDERLRGLGIALLDVIPPVVDGYVPVFAPFVRSGDHIHLSGRLGTPCPSRPRPAARVPAGGVVVARSTVPEIG